jgi:hypothetical protein
MRTEGVAGKATEANAHWAPERISVPKSATNERNLRIPGRSGSAARTRPIAGISPQFEGFRSTTENRGVPGSSPGLAIRKAARLLDLLVSGAALEQDTDRDTRSPVFSRPSPDRPWCRAMRKRPSMSPVMSSGARFAGAQCSAASGAPLLRLKDPAAIAYTIIRWRTPVLVQGERGGSAARALATSPMQASSAVGTPGVAASPTASATPTGGAVLTWPRPEWLAYGAQHVPRIRRVVRRGPRPEAGSQSGACPGKGILGRNRTTAARSCLSPRSGSGRPGGSRLRSAVNSPGAVKATA